MMPGANAALPPVVTFMALQLTLMARDGVKQWGLELLVLGE